MIPEDINEFDIPEEKPKIDVMPVDSFLENKLKRHIEEQEEDYDRLAIYDLGCQLNFQVTFGDGGGQDWMVGKLKTCIKFRIYKIIMQRSYVELHCFFIFLR